MAYTNPNQIIRLHSRMGGRGSVYEANMWAQQYKEYKANTGITSGSDAQLVGYMAGSAGVTQNTSADMNVIVNGTPTNPSVVLGVNPAGYKVALDIVGSTVLPITAPASNSRYSLVVAYADDLSLASSDTTITGNPSKNGVIIVNGASAATPAFPSDADIRSAITADGATGSQAVYAILSYGIIASTTTTITNALLTMPKAVMSFDNGTIPASAVKMPTLSKINTWSGPEAYGTTVHCQRTGNHVDLYIDGFTNNYMPATNTSSETVPVGFRPMSGVVGRGPLRSGNSYIGIGTINNNGTLSWWMNGDPGNNNEITFHTSYCTTDAWPTVGTDTDVQL